MRRGGERQEGEKEWRQEERLNGRDPERGEGHPTAVVGKTPRAGPEAWEPWKGRQGRRSGLQGRAESGRGVGGRRLGEEGCGDKGSHAARPGSSATGEREGSGNLKVKMQITQPGDGNPGGGGRKKGEEREAVSGAGVVG